MPSEAALEVSKAFNSRAEQHGWPSICDPSLAFRRPELTALLAIWREKAGTSGIPRREDITHHLLKPLLPDVAIYERVQARGERRYRVRLIGTKFANVMGDLTGRYLDDAVPAQFLPRWHAALDAAIDARAPLRFLSRSDTANKSFLVAEYFEAPMLNEAGVPNMILAASHFSGAESWAQVSAAERRHSTAEQATGY